ncbi:DUF4407 domain-containing protein [Pedobacter nototheniae]|uniref:DUF4407 domain-containing protein n=1 Tax=Pedobacter nototheniae TaxID=2488994 RepID=UPI00103D573A|nr:DUF4407 domain-containing protein [Pedobacter nototheniae]
MKKFQIWWLKTCCLLTGYNFNILSNCSEISVRKVKKYSASLLIVTIIWAFVGYCFCDRYIKLGVIGSMFGSAISILIIIQIERQILLADKTNFFLKITRIGLALLMSVIGSLIIDQIIFKDDIDKNKMASNQNQVNILLPGRTNEITNQIANLNSSLSKKEQERKDLVDDINKNPTKQITETSTNQIPISNSTTDSTKKSVINTTLKKTISTSIRVITNPKISQLEPIDNQIRELSIQKINKENILLRLRALLENEVKSKVGFLDELKIMLDILKQSTIALVVYIIWLSFLLLLELLILIGKSNELESDYDKTIQKQMDIHLRKIELL